MTRRDAPACLQCSWPKSLETRRAKRLLHHLQHARAQAATAKDPLLFAHAARLELIMLQADR